MDDYLVRTDEYRGYKINIRQDQDAESPREWENMGNMICWHRSYDLGDKHSYDDTYDLMAQIGDTDVDSEAAYDMDVDELRAAVMARANVKAVIIPLFLYDHSGITMSCGNGGWPFNCPWDAGQVGWIYVTLEDMREAGHDWQRWSNKRRKLAADWLKGEVETFDNYITGSVYGYSVENAEEDYLDSCSGYYGDPDENTLIDDAKHFIDCAVAEGEEQYKLDVAKALSRLKNYIKFNIPIIYRKQFNVDPV